MTQLLLFVLLHCVGTSACLAAGIGHRPHLCGALGFVTGAVVTITLELALLLSGIGFTPITGLVAIALTTTGCLAVTHRRGRIEPSARRILARWLLGFVALAAVMTRANVSMLTYDSHYIVMYGGVIANDGEFAPGVLQQLGDYGVFQVLAQSLSVFTNKSFLWAFTPTFAVSTMIAFGVLLGAGLDALGARMRWRALVVALVTVATFTIYMVFRHAFYLQTNFGTAAYLLVYCALFWLAEVGLDHSVLPIAFLALFGLSTHRIEGPLVAVLFLSLTVLPSRLPARALLPPLAIVALATCGWYLLLGNAALPESEFLTPGRAYLMASLPVAFTAYYAISTISALRFLRYVNRWSPAVVSAATVIALVAGFTLRYDHLRESADGWYTTLAHAPYWEGGWLAIVGIALLGLFVPAPPFRWVFVVGVAANMALILLLSVSRTPYYVGLGDSAARMAIHAVPLAFFYFGLKFVPRLAPPAVPSLEPSA